MKKMYMIIIIILITSTIILISANSTQKNSSQDNIENWEYNKNEYPHDEYTLEELPVPHKSAYEIRKFFDESDLDHDGILKNQEIKHFDYKIKHSQSNFNGPYGYN